MADFNTLHGRTLTAVNGAVGDDRMVFTCDDGAEFALYHSQNCCESVAIEDIAGDLDDLIGSPLTMAEESVNDPPADLKREYTPESETWTFYRLGTVKGSVVVRWHGESNGYYSESVYFEESK